MDADYNVGKSRDILALVLRECRDGISAQASTEGYCIGLGLSIGLDTCGILAAQSVIRHVLSHFIFTTQQANRVVTLSS